MNPQLGKLRCRRISYGRRGDRSATATPEPHAEICAGRLANWQF